jgi:hypothetical protein
MVSVNLPRLFAAELSVALSPAMRPGRPRQWRGFQQSWGAKSAAPATACIRLAAAPRFERYSDT